MAKPNYQYEKRQKDIAKKKKQEEKRLRKLEKKQLESGEQPAQPGVGGEAAEPGSEPVGSA